MNINLDNVPVEDANEMAHAHIASLPKEKIPFNFDGVTCVDCGLSIELERLAMFDTCRCGECKMWHDKETQQKRLKGFNCE